MSHKLRQMEMRIHACAEPYIIATHRQLSCMHPIYKLLHPHMRYTLQVNAFSRKTFISADGIVEALDSAGKYGVELSFTAYKNLWQLDMEALPADLVRRGMAVEDPTAPCGVKLVIEEYYPSAADGLLVWSAIKELVESYVEHYYSEPKSIMLDVDRIRDTPIRKMNLGGQTLLLKRTYRTYLPE
ncbi:hypothetical protein KY285_023377 [Solanum tuberosum]|nr:hypothetical protein KY289_023714 [Solanum tuberosum]KAH0675576.1 hypothetical protein KY285_023377 [Solanum tuberosum]